MNHEEMEEEVKEAVRARREKIKQKAIDALWDRGWTQADIAVAVSKSPKYVEDVRKISFLRSW
jgi:hypothetical protein